MCVRREYTYISQPATLLKKKEKDDMSCTSIWFSSFDGYVRYFWELLTHFLAAVLLSKQFSEVLFWSEERHPSLLNPLVGVIKQNAASFVQYGTVPVHCCGSGSGIRILFDPWIRDREQFFSGSRILDQTHIFESFMAIFWVTKKYNNL